MRNIPTLLDLLADSSGVQINHAKSAFSLGGLQTTTRRGVIMCRGLGNTNWATTYAVLGSTIAEGSDVKHTLATSH